MTAQPWEDSRLAANGQSIQNNFTHWFQRSQVLSPEGAPRVLFHGTNQPILRLQGEHLGANTSPVSSRLGFWFTDNPVVAAEYAEMAANRVEHERRVTDLLASIDVAQDRGDWDLAERLTPQLEDLSCTPCARSPRART